jgi:hypothetical protein
MLVPSMGGAHDLQGFPLEGMMSSHDGDLRGEVLEVGSVSCVPLTGSTTTS